MLKWRCQLDVFAADGREGGSDFCWKRCNTTPRQDAMASAEEAVPVISGRAEKMTKLETVCMGSDAARHQKDAPLRADKRRPPPCYRPISISRWSVGSCPGY